MVDLLRGKFDADGNQTHPGFIDYIAESAMIIGQITGNATVLQSARDKSYVMRQFPMVINSLKDATQNIFVEWFKNADSVPTKFKALFNSAVNQIQSDYVGTIHGAISEVMDNVMAYNKWLNDNPSIKARVETMRSLGVDSVTTRPFRAMIHKLMPKSDRMYTPFGDAQARRVMREVTGTELTDSVRDLTVDVATLIDKGGIREMFTRDHLGDYATMMDNVQKILDLMDANPELAGEYQLGIEKAKRSMRKDNNDNKLNIYLDAEGITESNLAGKLLDAYRNSDFSFIGDEYMRNQLGKLTAEIAEGVDLNSSEARKVVRDTLAKQAKAMMNAKLLAFFGSGIVSDQAIAQATSDRKSVV